MPGSGTGLATARKAAKDAVPLPTNDSASAIAYATALNVADSTAIWNYFIANIVVNVASVSGVTSGPSSSGPGTGTIS